MKSFVFLLLLSCSENSLQQAKQIDNTQLVLDVNQGLVLFQGEPFSGFGLTYAKDSLVIEEISYVEGEKHGLTQKWFDNGTLSYAAEYNDGKLDGWSRSLWKDGKYRSESFFVDGVVDGTQRQWYQSGQLFKELNFKMGVAEGMQKAWRENGAIYNNFEIVNGRIFGLKRATLCYELEDETIQYAE